MLKHKQPSRGTILSRNTVTHLDTKKNEIRELTAETNGRWFFIYGQSKHQNV
jgi:hypothetical protein